MRKIGYRLVELLRNRGYLDGIIHVAKNEGYDMGFEDGFQTCKDQIRKVVSK